MASPGRLNHVRVVFVSDPGPEDGRGIQAGDLYWGEEPLDAVDRYILNRQPVDRHERDWVARLFKTVAPGGTVEVEVV